VDGGARELDIMVNVGWLRSGLDVEYREDIARVVEAARPATVKVMLELPLLSPAERDRAVDLAVDAGVRFVKNASSSAVGVATPDQIRYLRDRAPASVGVKASGGIKSWEHAVELFEAGADLVGSSAGVAIVLRQAGAVSY
jgi:deoxyribose-phosphate aldolase